MASPDDGNIGAVGLKVWAMAGRIVELINYICIILFCEKNHFTPAPAQTSMNAQPVVLAVAVTQKTGEEK